MSGIESKGLGGNRYGLRGLLVAGIGVGKLGKNATQLDLILREPPAVLVDVRKHLAGFGGTGAEIVDQLLKVVRIVALSLPSLPEMLNRIRSLPLIPQVQGQVSIKLRALLHVGNQVALKQLAANRKTTLEVPVSITGLIESVPTKFPGGRTVGQLVKDFLRYACTFASLLRTLISSVKPYCVVGGTQILRTRKLPGLLISLGGFQALSQPVQQISKLTGYTRCSGILSIKFQELP